MKTVLLNNGKKLELTDAEITELKKMPVTKYADQVTTIVRGKKEYTIGFYGGAKYDVSYYSKTRRMNQYMATFFIHS